MAGYDGSIRINTEITAKGAEKELKHLEGSISKTAFKIASLRSKMDALKDVKLPTDEDQTIQNQIDETEKKIDDLLARQEKFLATGGKESSSTYQRMQYDIDELKASLPYLKGELQDLVDTGEAFTLGSNSEEYAKMSAQMQQLNQQMQSDTQRQSELQFALAAEEERLAQIKANATVSDQQILNLLERRKQLIAEIKDMESAGVGLGYQQYEDANRELEEVNGKIKDYRKNLGNIPEKFEKMRKSANKAFNAVASGTKKSSGLLSTFSSRLKGIALSLLIFNWVSKGFNAMISGMKKGFENFMGYSDSYAQGVQNMKNAMSTLGNQFAAAFAPIVQMVIPWLNSLINVLTKAIAHVSQFFAILGGKSTFTRAVAIQDKYNKALGGTAAAAKKAFGALARFDDLDVMQKQEDASGGGAETTLPKDMFEEVPVDKKALSWLDGIIERAKELKDIFMQGFWEGLGDYGYRFKSINNGILLIEDSLKDIWSDKNLLKSMDAFQISAISLFGSIVGSVSSIALTVASNFIGGISKYFEQNKEQIKAYLISMFEVWDDVNTLFSDLFSSIAYIFEVFASENGQELTANILGIFSEAFMGITEFVSELFADVASVIIQPFVDNKEAFREALEGFLGVLSEVTGTIKNGIQETFSGLKEMYNTHFKPFFDSVAQGLSDTVGKFMDFWNGSVQPILNEWAEGFDVLWAEHLQPMLDKLVAFLGKVGDLLLVLWETILKPVIDWIIDNVLPVILPIIKGIGDAIGSLFAMIGDVVGGIFDIFGGLIDFVVGVFTGDWERAWNGIVDVFKGIFNLIPAIIEGILNIAIDLINGLVDGINAVTGLVGIPEIPDIPNVKIPRLATGAVIRGGNPFMAILGDQPVGKTNIEAPLDTIKQAVREELSGLNFGNAGGGTLQVVLNVNGENLAQATLSNFLSEMKRQGYDVSVLGVT